MTRTVSIAVAAKLLEMSPRRIRELIALGIIPAVRFSERAHWRVVRSFVDAYRTELDRKSAEAAEDGRAYARRALG